MPDGVPPDAWTLALLAFDDVPTLQLRRDGQIVSASPSALKLLGGSLPATGDVAHLANLDAAQRETLLEATGLLKLKASLYRANGLPLAVTLLVFPADEVVAVLLLVDAEPLIAGHEALGDINSQLTNLTRERAKHNAKLAVALDRVTDQQREIHAQNLTLDAQAEAMQVRNEELDAQSEELHAQNLALQALNRELEASAFQLERLVAELAVANEQLRDMDRLKMQFYANMNHELRTPLNSIIGFAEDALEGLTGPLNDAQRDAFSTILNSGQRQLALVGDILDLAKLQSNKTDLHPARFAIGPVVEEIRATMKPLVARKRQTLEVADLAGLPEIDADKDKLYQILLNLVSNAHKYTPEGGRLSVRARPADGFLHVEVADNGQGIPPDDLPKLFDAFHQVKGKGPRQQGTGLGLAITKRLVDLHGGRLSVSSTPGSGSVFAFTMPLASPAEVPG